MSETKHTPGPWEVTAVSMNTGNVTVNQPDLRIVIAEVTNAASFGDMLVGAMRRGGGALDPSDSRTMFANARLIAAAPDMLEALRKVVKQLEDMGADGSASGADAAIAKATGEAS